MEFHFTFICLADNQVAVRREARALAQDACRAYAFKLLREHAAAASVEIWRGQSLWEVVARDGVRAIGGPGAWPLARDEASATEGPPAIDA